MKKTGENMKFWKTICLTAVTLCILGTAVPVMAQESETPMDNVVMEMTRKLGRGITNAGFGVLELPLKMYEVNFEEGGFAACTYGVFYGLYFVLKREIVGVIDIATFLVPLPDCRQDPNEAGWGYGPLMRPEWIITPDKNYYNFVYPSTKTIN